MCTVISKGLALAGHGVRGETFLTDTPLTDQGGMMRKKKRSAPVAGARLDDGDGCCRGPSPHSSAAFPARRPGAGAQATYDKSQKKNTSQQKQLPMPAESQTPVQLCETPATAPCRRPVPTHARGGGGRVLGQKKAPFPAAVDERGEWGSWR